MAVDRSVNVPSAIIMVVGLWLIVSPFVLGETPSFERGIVGVILAGMFIALLAAGNIWGRAATGAGSPVLSWLVVALGAWVAAAPFVLGYASNTRWTWSSLISGVIVFALGLVDATARPLATVESRLAARVPGPWVRGRYLPAVAYEGDDHLLWASGLGRRSAPAEADREGEFRGVGPRNWRRPDEQILADLCERMAEHPRLDASEIEVAVANGEVLLQGVAVSRRARRLAEDIADSVSGVRDVRNELRVRDRRGEVRRAA